MPVMLFADQLVKDIVLMHVKLSSSPKRIRDISLEAKQGKFFCKQELGAHD